MPVTLGRCCPSPLGFSYIVKALSEGNYPALTQDEKNHPPLHFLVYIKWSPFGFFSRNDLVKTTILGKDI